MLFLEMNRMVIDIFLFHQNWLLESRVQDKKLSNTWYSEERKMRERKKVTSKLEDNQTGFVIFNCYLRASYPSQYTLKTKQEVRREI